MKAEDMVLCEGRQWWYLLTKWPVWVQASTMKQPKTVLFWAIMQRVVVISYRCFRTTCWFHLQESSFLTSEDGTNSPEEQRSQNGL